MEREYKRPTPKKTFINTQPSKSKGKTQKPVKKKKKTLSKKDKYTTRLKSVLNGNNTYYIEGEKIVKLTIEFNIHTQQYIYNVVENPRNKKDFSIKFRPNPWLLTVCYFDPEKLNKPRYSFDTTRVTVSTLLHKNQLEEDTNWDRIVKYMVESFILPKYLDWLN